MTRPSWQDFGTHDESAFPQLWDGVVGAWAPCLGPTGSRLHDMSRRANWGTLTNMDSATDWVVSDGQYALDLDGSNDYADCGTAINLLLLGEMTVAAWVRFDVLNTLQALVSNTNAAGTSCSFQLEFGRTANKLTWLQNGNSVDATSTATITDGGWHLIAAVRSGRANAWIVSLSIDAAANATSTAVNPNGTTGNCAIGRAGSYPAQYVNGVFAECAVWNRPLSQNEIRQFYELGRGGMYQRRRRRSIYLPQAGAIVIQPPNAGWIATTQQRHWIARTQQRFFIWTPPGPQ